MLLTSGLGQSRDGFDESSLGLKGHKFLRSILRGSVGTMLARIKSLLRPSHWPVSRPLAKIENLSTRDLRHHQTSPNLVSARQNPASALQIRWSLPQNRPPRPLQVINMPLQLAATESSSASHSLSYTRKPSAAPRATSPSQQKGPPQ